MKDLRFQVAAWDALAEEYFDHISSPFEQGVDNPLFSFLEKLRNKKRQAVADVGCGPGNLLPFLAKRFGKVLAIDFSLAMLAVAKRVAPFENVEFFKKDIRKLSSLANQVDIAISVNSILVPSLLDVDRCLREIWRIIRPSGKLVGIFPAMESVICEAMMDCERQLRGGISQQMAIRSVRKKIDAENYIFETGHFQDSDMTQKFFYQFELSYRLHKAGFSGVRFQRVEYPHSEDCQNDGEPRLWDWFVVATKTKKRF